MDYKKSGGKSLDSKLELAVVNNRTMVNFVNCVVSDFIRLHPWERLGYTV